MQTDNRNMIVAIVLSVIVLFGWQFFIAGPQMERAQRNARIEAEQAAQDAALATPATTSADGTAVPATDAAGNRTFADRQTAVAATARVAIDTAALKGSINLTGGRLDDLRLKKYTETVDPTSPIITLLTPSGAPDGYFVEQGWVPANGGTVKTPDRNSVWIVNGEATTLTEATPVTLSWDNGAGLVFRRAFAVDSNYLFTITQSVENRTAGDVALFPYAKVVREGTPKVQ
ncbi:MAG: membrane protein insertase YidC, partial [Devosia sp.]